MSTRLNISGTGMGLVAKPVAFFANRNGARIGFVLLNLSAQYETRDGRRRTVSQCSPHGNLILNCFANDDGSYSFTVFGGRIHGNSDLGVLLAQMAESCLKQRPGPIPANTSTTTPEPAPA